MVKRTTKAWIDFIDKLDRIAPMSDEDTPQHNRADLWLMHVVSLNHDRLTPIDVTDIAAAWLDFVARTGGSYYVETFGAYTIEQRTLTAMTLICTQHVLRRTQLILEHRPRPF